MNAPLSKSQLESLAYGLSRKYNCTRDPERLTFIVETMPEKLDKNLVTYWKGLIGK